MYQGAHLRLLCARPNPPGGSLVFAHVLVFDFLARVYEDTARSSPPERLHRSLPDRHLSATPPRGDDRRKAATDGDLELTAQ
jgi:hypothetical protein